MIDLWLSLSSLRIYCRKLFSLCQPVYCYALADHVCRRRFSAYYSLQAFFRLTWFMVEQDIGGYDTQKQEIREAVELPLTHHELYKQIGIDPPRGVLLYGPPGTGKTMLAKAVAHHTTAAFIRVVGSEFVQKYLGEVCS
jgi:predicted ATPase